MDWEDDQASYVGDNGCVAATLLGLGITCGISASGRIDGP